jgi:hypothetical protein
MASANNKRKLDDDLLDEELAAIAVVNSSNLFLIQYLGNRSNRDMIARNSSIRSTKHRQFDHEDGSQLTDAVGTTNQKDDDASSDSEAASNDWSPSKNLDKEPSAKKVTNKKSSTASAKNNKAATKTATAKAKKPSNIENSKVKAHDSTPPAKKKKTKAKLLQEARDYAKSRPPDVKAAVGTTTKSETPARGPKRSLDFSGRWDK